MFLDSLCLLCVSLYKASPLFSFALFWCGIYGFLWDSDHNVKMFLPDQYTLCCIFVLVLIKTLLYLFLFFKENPLDNSSALRLMILGFCSAIDAVFHTHYCHVWPSADTSPTVWLLPGDHLSSSYDGFKEKTLWDAPLFYFIFCFWNCCLCCFLFHFLNWAFSVRWLFAVFSLFVCYYQYGVSDGN